MRLLYKAWKYSGLSIIIIIYITLETDYINKAYETELWSDQMELDPPEHYTEQLESCSDTTSLFKSNRCENQMNRVFKVKQDDVKTWRLNITVYK